MGTRIIDIPEVRGLDTRGGLIRIPPEIDVPVSRRVRQLIDCRAFQRLSRISQLGLVSFVYPAAHHSRFEHSLGVYRIALLYLRQLARDERFEQIVSKRDAEVFIVAAILHDIGHWPFCHPIEDLRLENVPQHEEFAVEFIQEQEIADVLHTSWGVEPWEVVSLLRGESQTNSAKVLQTLLSGPIDIDKMDYLGRDSLHAGVPYGRNYDQARLIGSLCLNETGSALAITEKGRTAAEMMVFARYVMFSEVYWHHAVRAATAMLQRAFYYLREAIDLRHLFFQDEDQVKRELVLTSSGTPAEALLQGLFGNHRRLFKRVEQYSLFQRPEIYQRLTRRPYAWLVECADRLAQRLSKQLGQRVRPEQVLLDAPPMKREIEIDIEVYFPKEARYRALAEVSPVVQTLAEKQFDDYVKRVRVFVAPEIVDVVRQKIDMAELLLLAITETEDTCPNLSARD